MKEEEIIQGIRAEGRLQQQALEALYRKGAEFRRHYVFKGLSPEAAHDVLQEAIVRIFKSAASYTGDGGFGDASANAWMWRIAKNCLVDELRRLKSRATEDSLDDDALDEGAEDRLEAAIQAHAAEPRKVSAELCVSEGLENFAAEHPDRARALEMQIDGEDIASIARRIGRTTNATKAYLCECRKKLAPFIAHCLPLLSV